MRLSSITTRNGDFCLIDFSQPAKLAELLGLDLTLPANHQSVAQAHRLLLTTLAANSSGVVLDAEWGLPAWPEVHASQTDSITTGLLLGFTDQQSDPEHLPTLTANWGIEAVKNNYGVALLDFAYHPREKQAIQKKQFLAEVADYCIYQQLDLVVRLKLFPQAGLTPSTDDLVLAVQELQRHAAALILQPPADALTAATLTAELDRPWIVELTQPEYAATKETLRMALEAGAHGYMATNLWSEVSQFRDPTSGVSLPALQTYAQTTLRDHLLELNRITAEAI